MPKNPIKPPALPEQLTNLEQQKITTEILSRYELHKAVEEIMQTTRKSPQLFILFAGDRLTCCDQGTAVLKDQKIVNLTTVAPFGEEYSGRPSIVATYTLPEHRRQGLATLGVSKTIKLCESMGWTPVHADLISRYAKGLVNKLPPKLQQLLQVCDHTSSVNIDIFPEG